MDIQPSTSYVDFSSYLDQTTAEEKDQPGEVEIILDFLEQYPDLAHRKFGGIFNCNTDFKAKWDELSQKLNAAGFGKKPRDGDAIKKNGPT